MRRKKD